jgi:hypothetical protein
VHFVDIDDDRSVHDWFDHHLLGSRVHHIDRNDFDHPPSGN